MSLKNKTLYWIKGGDGFTCPLCGSKLDGCHIGEFCSKKSCPYVDGVAWLTPKKAEKHKDKIVGKYRLLNSSQR